MRNGLAFFILFFLAFGALPLRAETLDETSLRGIYDEGTASIHDPQKMHELMEQRLDENFSFKLSVATTFGNNPPQRTVKNLTKTETVNDAMQGTEMMKIETYENKIIEIEYSEDNRYAYVQNTTSASGTINIPQSNGQLTPAHYTTGQTCLDTFTLVNTVIKETNSECSQQLVVAK